MNFRIWWSYSGV